MARKYRGGRPAPRHYLVKVKGGKVVNMHLAEPCYEFIFLQKEPMWDGSRWRRVSRRKYRELMSRGAKGVKWRREHGSYVVPIG
jgi:hypothetical protein